MRSNFQEISQNWSKVLKMAKNSQNAENPNFCHFSMFFVILWSPVPWNTPGECPKTHPDPGFSDIFDFVHTKP